jgi:hypothetical protein
MFKEKIRLICLAAPESKYLFTTPYSADCMLAFADCRQKA